MAFWQSYAIALAFNNVAGLVNLETYFVDPLRAIRRVPIGAVTEQASDGWEVTDGHRFVTLQMGGTTFARLTAYITAIHTSFDGPETVEATLRFRHRSNVFDDYNVYAYMPKEGEDYTHLSNGLIEELQLRYLILSDAV